MECARCAMLQQQVSDRDRFIDLDQAEIKRRGLKIEQLSKAVALLNSMVLSGESHSETSRQVVREALA